jgi:hypothetical protein
VTQYQTCRRHPDRRFLRTCGGCAQELHDLQARNVNEAAARTALATIGTVPAARILNVIQTYRYGADLTLLIVATERAAREFRFAVDVFRLATRKETDPDLGDDALPVGAWVLVDQWGGHDETEHARQWAAAIAEYGPKRIDLTARALEVA